MTDLKEYENIVLSLGFSYDEFTQLVKEYKLRHGEAFTDEQIVKLVLRSLRRMSKSLQDFKAIFIGYEKDDIYERMRRIATAVFQNNPEEAIARGLTDADGNPLDTRDMIAGRPNPNYRKPIPPDASAPILYIYGYFQFKGGLWERMRTICMFENANMEVPLFKVLTFKAIYKGTEQTWHRINFSKLTSFRETGEDVLSILEQIGIRKLKELQTFRERQFFPILTKGIVTNVRLEPNMRGERLVYLDDESLTWEDLEIGVRIPKGMPITFKEGDEILVSGFPSILERDGDFQVFLKACGVLVLNYRSGEPKQIVTSDNMVITIE